jgi:hypothetical protein
MPADLDLIMKTWRSLQPFVREEKCAACECLQGALVELRLDLDELPTSPSQQDLLDRIGRATETKEPHACLGCQPCNPGDLLADYYRAREARVYPAQSCCDEG